LRWRAGRAGRKEGDDDPGMTEKKRHAVKEN
jgi:hypothetical protein